MRDGLRPVELQTNYVSFVLPEINTGKQCISRKLRKQQRISVSTLTSREKQTILKSMKALRAV